MDHAVGHEAHDVQRAIRALTAFSIAAFKRQVVREAARFDFMIDTLDVSGQNAAGPQTQWPTFELPMMPCGKPTHSPEA